MSNCSPASMMNTPSLTRAVVPSVVSIDTAGVRTVPLFDVWGRTRSVRNYPTQGQGSGVIVTHEGHVVTNHHVIAGQQKIQVTLHNGKTYPAHLIGEDTLLDIAVLKIDASETFTPLKLGDSTAGAGRPDGIRRRQSLRPRRNRHPGHHFRQRTLALRQPARPFPNRCRHQPGQLRRPARQSARRDHRHQRRHFLSRQGKPGLPRRRILDSCQRREGRARSKSSNAAGRSAGFSACKCATSIHPCAPPCNTMAKTARPCSAFRRVRPPKLPGCNRGMSCVSFNGTAIRSATQLFTLVQGTRVGDAVTLGVWRKGELLELKATITESGGAGTTREPAEEARTKAAGAIRRKSSKPSASTSATFAPERMRGFRGVVVTGLTPNGLAASQVRPGDFIIAVNNARISGASRVFPSSWPPRPPFRTPPSSSSAKANPCASLLPALPRRGMTRIG